MERRSQRTESEEESSRGLRGPLRQHTEGGGVGTSTKGYGDVLRLLYAFSEEGSINMNFRAGACESRAHCGNDPGRAHVNSW